MAPVPLLVIGYALAVPGVATLLRIVRRRSARAFALLEAGTAMIVAGWALKRRWAAVAINSAAFVGFAAYWVTTGRRALRAQTRPGPTTPGSRPPA